MATKIVSWVLQVALAGVFIAMGAVPKLLGQFPSPQLFETLGAEPAGRYFVGTWELVAAVLILIPKTAVYGALLIVLAMAGAFASHLGPLGVSPEFTNPKTGGTEAPPMFFMAIGLLMLGAVVVFLRRDQLPVVGKSGDRTPATTRATPAEAGE